MDENREGISRREVLKRVGAGVAVAWTAPVLTSLGSPAFGQTPVCSQTCSGFEPCGFDGLNPCSCLQAVEGGCECHECVFCEERCNVVPCKMDADCPDGYFCAVSSGCGENLCHPLCGTEQPEGCDCIGSGPRRTGRTSSR